ncbi:RNA polymerase II holoenzyme cyclin-like subunit [Yamadazyma tenuis]|uniref:Cyclin-like domain-containing protein n=1 Tax=Candida tenuis (strain ATCC 10573 / BCRC 21748 / CBS 615 / JCM 9827 / NBRC 10315 / NRRL Y-1498 / VKM Y-70) TaxID=590646 RepID=G3B6U1_CANTC|nr:uncharacterized protein CANTEDRAFT_122693 [Yamadazyma tenuis ATCC 10573]EGV63019.1 hypothetical protein CANTEDRAFT_122693 [Yamadazyma tenuis ATCC 10573]WEJ97162.1 RNA polymerase II holoenzyme cyclin-like subunit [Yamadazyma tenuis]
MSADFWSSSQRGKWQFNRQSLLDQRRRLLILEKKMIQNGFIKDYPNITYDSNMRIYLHNLLIRLGRRLNVRQVPLATAEVYLSRFLLKVSLKEINVYLMVTACIYVASKVEECPQHIRLIISEARNLWPEYIPHEVSKLAEFEFYLLEEMDLFLILHHPYRSLIQLQRFLTANLDQYHFLLTNDELQHTWSLINDSYITDLPLLFPPHIIAVSCVYITIVLKKALNSIRLNKSITGDGMGAGSTGGGSTGDDHPESAQMDAHGTDKEMHIDDLMALTSENSASDNNALESGSGLQDMKLDEDTIRINRFMNFLGHSHINLDEVSEAMQDIINVYVIWNRYNEANVKKSLQYMLLNR